MRSVHLYNSNIFLIFQYDELVQLEVKIKSKITGADSGTDVGYWGHSYSNLIIIWHRSVMDVTAHLVESCFLY